MKQDDIGNQNRPETVLARVVVQGNEFGPHRRARPSLGKSAGNGRAARIKASAAAETLRLARVAVGRQIIQAGETLRRLPAVPTPGNSGSSWPAIIREFADLVGNDTLLKAKAAVRPASPSPRAIADMDQVLEWMLWLDVEKRKVAWAKMLGLGFRKIERRMGLSRSKIARLWDAAIDLIILRISTK